MLDTKHRMLETASMCTWEDHTWYIKLRRLFTYKKGIWNNEFFVPSTDVTRHVYTRNYVGLNLLCSKLLRSNQE